MHKKYHEKFKILDIFAVTTQAHEGIETYFNSRPHEEVDVTTQAHEGIETLFLEHKREPRKVTTQAHEGIETVL